MHITTCGLHIRLKRAALHFNENSNREQVVTINGEERYDIVFPKYKYGGYIVRKVLKDPTYGNCGTYTQLVNVEPTCICHYTQVTSVN